MSAEPATADPEDGARPPDTPQQEDAAEATDSEGARRGRPARRLAAGALVRPRHADRRRRAAPATACRSSASPWPPSCSRPCPRPP